MDINRIEVGKNPPWDVNVVIEIPYKGEPVKYEIDKASGALFVDRFLSTAMYYPANYGFVPHTLAEDGDPVDALVLGRAPVIAGAVIRARPIGVLVMEDEAGLDEKILMVPVTKLDAQYDTVKTHEDVPEVLRQQIAHFFEHYKDLEPNKWVKILRWDGPEAAAKIIEKALQKEATK